MFTMIVSFSIVDTLATTSTSTPTNIFMTVNVANRMKTIKRHAKNILSSPTSFTQSARSGNVPLRSKLEKPAHTVGKYLIPIGFLSVTCRNTNANKYTVRTKSTSVKNTDFDASHKPFNKIIN